MITKTGKVWLGGAGGITRPLTISQYDTGWTFALSVYIGSALYDPAEAVAVTLEGDKPDGTAFAIPGTFSAGVATFAIPADVSAVSGTVACELRVSVDDETVGTANFDIIVEAAPLAQHVTSEDNFAAMQALLDEVSQDAASAAQSAATAESAAGTAAQTVLDQTPAMVDAWLEDNIDPSTGYALDRSLQAQNAAAPADLVGDLKSALTSDQKNTFLSPITYNIPSNTWTVGQGVAPNSGKNITNDKYARSNYIRFTKPTFLYFDNSDYDFIVWEYSDQSVSSAEFAPREYYSDAPVIVSVEQGVTDFRIGAKRKDDSDMTASDVTTLIAALKTYTLTDTTLAISGAPADAESTGNKLKVVTDASVHDLMGYADHTTKTSGDITYTNTGKNTWTVNGTLNGTSSNPLFSSNSGVAPFVVGKKYRVWFTSGSANVKLQLYKYVGDTLTLAEEIFNKEDFQSMTIPVDATGILLRFRTTASVSNVAVTCWIYEDSPTFDKFDILDAEDATKIGYQKALSHTDDLNNITTVGVYGYVNSDKPENAPTEESNGVLTVFHGFTGNGFYLQLVSTYTGKLFQRLRYTNSTWTVWAEISKGGTTVQNTYNITTSPTITTDANGWLQAVDTDTSDETGKTDMTGAILSMLTDTGYCHLGEGIFYISGNIDMPENSMLCGCGKKTVIRLLQSATATYCAKMGKYCTIKDVSFEGPRGFSMPDTKGTINGIAFMAEYDATPSVTTEHCMISNVWCKNFSGAGIYCHNTSINYAKGVYVSNAFIYACFVGIDIDYYSEFNKFVNVCAAWCKYGCINNGGNNVFTSCTFHATVTGFYIDGSQPNSAHGTINGCTFCHIGSNQGKAIEIVGATAGFIINACQIWYNSIHITNSKGIIVSNCEFGRGTTGAGATIVISGGDTVMFVGDVFMDDVNYAPDITITNNNKVKFVNCYGGASGNAISAS